MVGLFYSPGNPTRGRAVVIYARSRVASAGTEVKLARTRRVVARTFAARTFAAR